MARFRRSSLLAFGFILCSSGPGIEAYVQNQNSNHLESSMARRSSRDERQKFPQALVRLIGGGTRDVNRVKRTTSRRSDTTRQMISVQAAHALRLKEKKTVIPFPSKSSSLSRVDFVVPFIYFCSAFVNTLPVILIPAIAHHDHQLSTMELTSFCATVASVAMVGGGAGKIINGMVCQRLGGVSTASLYMIGMSLSTFALSLSTSLSFVTSILAVSEFFFSAMWVSCSVMLSAQHLKNPTKFARGVTYMSLSAISGQLAAKTLGSVLLHLSDWRQVAQGASLVTLLGSFVVKLGLSDLSEKKPSSNGVHEQEDSILEKMKSIMKSKLFWMVGLAHISGYTGRTVDRILGPFLQQITDFPFQICGAMTSCVTIGMAYGVSKATRFYNLETVDEQQRFLKRSYSFTCLSLLGLALCASGLFNFFPPSFLALLTVLFSGFGSSAIAFQFFQIPNLVSSVVFSENKALCLACLDGLAFFLTSSVWACSSWITTSMGWSATWGFLVLLFGLCGSLMTSAIRPVLVEQSRQKET